MRVDWGNLSAVVEQAPFRLPAIFGGGRLVLYAFVPGNVDMSENVKLTAVVSTGAQFEASVPVNLTEISEGDHVTKLAAKAMIRDLEEGRSYMHDDKGNSKT